MPYSTAEVPMRQPAQHRRAFDAIIGLIFLLNSFCYAQSVTSFNSRTGAVTLLPSDITSLDSITLPGSVQSAYTSNVSTTFPPFTGAYNGYFNSNHVCTYPTQF